MSEFLRPTTSNDLNLALSDTVSAFSIKVAGTDWINSTPKTLEVEIAQNQIEPISASNEPLLHQFPDIYSANQGEYLTCKEGLDFSAPIGEYGAEWAKTLIESALILRDLAQNPLSRFNVIERSVRSREQRAEILEAAKKNKGLSVEIGKLAAFDEGLQSVLFAAGFFTAYEEPGFEDPKQFLQHLVNERLFSKFALIVPSTVTARMGYHGWVFTKPAIEGSRIASHVAQHFTSERRKYESLSTVGGTLLDRRGCPVARVLPGNDLSGIDMLAGLFTEVVKK